MPSYPAVTASRVAAGWAGERLGRRQAGGQAGDFRYNIHTGTAAGQFTLRQETETGQAIRHCTLENPITPWIRNTEKKYRNQKKRFRPQIPMTVAQ